MNKKYLVFSSYLLLIPLILVVYCCLLFPSVKAQQKPDVSIWQDIEYGCLAEWTTERKHTGLGSVKLIIQANAPQGYGAGVSVGYGETLNNIPTKKVYGTYEVVDAESFYFYFQRTVAGSHLPFIVISLDIEGDGSTDCWLTSVDTLFEETSGGWLKASPKPDSDGELGGWDGWVCWNITASRSEGIGPLGYWKTNYGNGMAKIDIDVTGENATEPHIYYIDDLIVGDSAFAVENPALIEFAHLELIIPNTQIVSNKSQIDTEVVVTALDKGIFCIAKYIQNPTGSLPQGFACLGKFIDVSTDISSSNIIWPITIRVYYTDVEISGVNETTLCMYYWDAQREIWVRCSNTGVDTQNNFLYSTVSNLTIFAPFGLPVEAPVPLVRVPPTVSTALIALSVSTVLTVGFTTMMSVSGKAVSFNSAVEKLNIPEWFKDFLKLYGEETFKILTKKDVETSRRKRLITKKEIMSLIFSALILLSVFTYIEVNGLPNFFNVNFLANAIPSVLVSVILVFVVSELIMKASLHLLDVLSDLKIWIYGLLSILTSGFIFLVPFASPCRTEYQGKLSKHKSGIIGIIKILSTLMLSILFYSFNILGFTTLADAGLVATFMTSTYSAFPFKPFEGEAVFQSNKLLWLSVFVPSFTLFISVIFNILPRTAYLVIGIIAFIIFISILVRMNSSKVKDRNDLEVTGH
jgi:hypothetical protein